jgi:transposase
MSASGRNKKYDREFKLEAIRLAGQPGAIARSVERDLGLYQGAIRHWREEVGAASEQAFPGSGHLKAQDEEVRRLRRELADARMERDILKKAMAIFSSPRK